MSKRETLLQRTLLKWDEIDRLGLELASLSHNKDEAFALFTDALIDAYIEGFAGAAYMLGVSEDIDSSAAGIDKNYGGETVFEKFDKYYNNEDAEGLKTLLSSEWHRCNEQGAYNCASRHKCKKEWCAILDNKTRETHAILDGTVVDADERFYSISGDSAMYPGDFETADENANCRCKVIYTEY